MQMTALKAHRYGPRQYRPGDEYEAKQTDVRLIKALGWAKETPPRPATPPAERPRLRMAAIAASAPETAAAEKPKRSYRRRDLSAEAS